MVDQFDPMHLRRDLLRRMAAAEAPQLSSQEPGLLAKCTEELLQWFCETPLMRLCRHCCHICHAGRSSMPSYVNECRGAAADGRNACENSVGCPSVEAETSAAGAGSTAAAQTLEPRPSGTASGRRTGAEAALGSTAAATELDSHARMGSCQCGHAVSSTACPASAQAESAPGSSSKQGFPARAIYGHLCGALQQLRKDIQVLLFLAFPSGSAYQDRTVEELFQWHYTRHWWLCLDWSSLALLLMLVWDVAMNPPYRVPLVLLFYAAFGTGLLLRKVLLFAAPSPPRNRRVWHNVLLCTFFFGRCVVCQPLLVNIATEGSRPFRTLQVEAFSSVIGLGMTNLSMVFMQQMQTIDMLLFCLVNGLVFILWIIFVLQMPLTDALHTAYVGSIVVTAVCVRQQRDLEDAERRTFEHELLHARGMLVRSADRISAQASSQELNMSMHVLNRVRRVEHLNF
mmetsp:Transcript_143165/g.275055  ORF Transcript_143165/g.275055 Transcript_143165/m.275055 type:complete len:456 (+) Transcript_143165:105-1472(+)